MPQVSPKLFDVVASLKARLPEIVWRLRDMESLRYHLPPGLFACVAAEPDCGVQHCVDEIMLNLEALEQTPHEHLGFFLVEKISRKIAVLLRLSQLSSTKASLHANRLGLQGLVTRQHYLQQLQASIAQLTTQYNALQSTLNHKLAQGLRDESVANVQRELGELTRCLTTAQESLAIATGSQWRNYR